MDPAAILSRFSPLVIVSDANGYIIYCNERACRHGFAQGELLQSSIRDIASQRTWMQIVAEATQSVPDTVWSLTLEMDCGQRFVCECGVQSTFNDAGEEVHEMCLVGVQTNLPIAHHHDASELERKFIYDMKFLGSTDHGVIATDSVGRIIYYDEGMEKMHGWKPSEMIGKSMLTTLAHETNMEEAEQIIAKLLSGQPWAGTLCCRRRDGSKIQINATDYPIFDPNRQLIGIVGVSCEAGTNAPHKPISSSCKEKLEVSIKAANKEADVQGFKTDLIMTMSHEMRTPLHAIIGESDNLEWLVKTELEKKTIKPDLASAIIDCLNTINGSSKIQLMLVNNMLDWQKLASGKVLLNYDLFDIREVIASICQNNRCLMRLKSLSCDVHIADSVPERINSDKFKLTQVLLNYVSNAIKFSPPESKIAIQCHTTDEHIQIAVEDEGPGVPAAQRHLLFQRFIQLPNGPYEKGTGLGLSICDQLARMVEGRVWYEERPKGGSRFSFSFPLRNLEDGLNGGMRFQSLSLERKESIDKTVFDQDDLPRPVLIVEDNMINQKVMVKMLKKIGYDPDKGDVVITNDGIEALEACEKQAFPLILMDMSMPRMNGVEATRELRRRGSQSCIIMISANIMDEHRQICIDAGCDDFVGKPVQVPQLRSAIFHGVFDI